MNMCKDTNQAGMTFVEYVDLYGEIRAHVDDRDVAMVILHEMAKDVRAMQLKRETLILDSGPATERQKAWLKKLHVDFPPSISYGEADEIIEGRLMDCETDR